MYKVIEVANMLNVSKVTIYKKMNLLKKELRPFVKKKRNITYIETGGIELIKSSLAQNIIENHPAISELTLKKLEDEKIDLINKIINKEAEIQRIGSSHIVDLENQLEYLNQQILIKGEVVKRKKATLDLFKLINKTNKESISFIEKLSSSQNS